MKKFLKEVFYPLTDPFGSRWWNNILKNHTFNYNDKVKFIDGFYSGQIGIIKKEEERLPPELCDYCDNPGIYYTVQIGEELVKGVNSLKIEGT